MENNTLQQEKIMMNILIIPVILVLFYIIAVKPFCFWKDRGVTQSSIFEAFYDNFFGLLLGNASSFIRNFYNKFPGSRYCGLYFFYSRVLVLRDPDLIKEMLIRDFEHFTDHKPIVSEKCDPLFGKNLFSLRGPQWRQMRPILSPSFTSSKMKSMFILIRKCAENFVHHFQMKNQNLISTEMKDAFTRFTNDVIATTAFGVEVDSLQNPNNEFYCLGSKTTDLKKFSKQLRFLLNSVFPYLCEVLKITFFEKDVRIFFSNLILDTIKTRRCRGIVRPDMIQLLMEAQKNEEDFGKKLSQTDPHEGVTPGKEKQSIQLTDEAIIAQALLFFFAGFDSASTVMCFMAHELAINPNVQEKLRQEILETSAKYQEELTYDALVNMKYMDMVVSETLRRWPATIGFERICTKPYTIEPVLPGEKPVYLEKGTGIIIPTFGIQNDPELFPNPERFDPERFSEENKVNLNPNALLVFGMGPRNCIGSRLATLKIKVVFFYILSSFKIVPVERTNIPLVLAKSLFQMGSEGGFWLGLEKFNK